MRRERKLFTVLAIMALVLMVRMPAWAGTAPGSGLTASIHDWSATGAHANKHVYTSPEGYAYTGVGQCTYCHTPHHAQSTLLLWNQKLSSNTFSWDVPATTAGTNFPQFSGLTYKGATAKCLSCHDGSVAVGDFNLYNETGESQGTPNPFLTFHISGAAQIATATGSLAGNHPVAMPYPYQQQQNTYNGVTTGSGFIPAQWQSTPVSPVVLYNDDGSGDITAGPVTGKSGMECSSCHDVHNDTAVDNYLLLGTLNGSDTNYICLKCHIK